jgi:hypothetical protein
VKRAEIPRSNILFEQIHLRQMLRSRG